MADPQREQGHLDIATEIVDQFCKYRIPGREWQMVWVILRKTWGWAVKDKTGNYVRDKNRWIAKKKKDWIPLSQFKKLTGIPRSKCCFLLKSLENKKIVKKHVPQKGKRKPIYYEFNKNYEEWKVFPKKVTVFPKRVTKVFPKKGLSKETLKKTLSRQTLKPEFFDLVNQLSELMLRNDSEAKVPRTESQKMKWANQFCLLVEKDKRPIEEVKAVLEWCEADSFWKGNILSAGKLRKKYPELRLKMKAEGEKFGKQPKLTPEEFDRLQKEALK